MTSITPKTTGATVHPTADVATSNIGSQTRILQFSVVKKEVIVGDHCQIDSHCMIQTGVEIGDRVSIGSGVCLAKEVEVGSDVEIGSNCTVGGDNASALPTVIRDGAALGANVTVAPGVEVGQYSRIEAGSVVTNSVPPGATVVGNPAVMQNAPLRTGDSPTVSPLRASEIHGVKFLSLQEIQDMRGTLTVCQWNQQLPFSPRRVFFLHGVPNENVRGAHAHKECDQALVCFNGSVNVLLDDGQRREEVILDSSTTGLLIPAGIWATQYRYSSNAMLVVFASHDYDADDYIRNYEDFLTFRRTGLDTAA